MTNDQAALLKIKLDELEVADLEFQNNLIENYENSIIQIDKEVNKNLAIYKYREFVNEFGGIKGIYLNSYDFLNSEKMSSIKTIIDETVVNTLVVDVKTDHGHLMYDSNLQESYEINIERIKFNKFKVRWSIFLEWCFGNPVSPESLRNGVSPDNLHGLAAVASGGRY